MIVSQDQRAGLYKVANNYWLAKRFLTQDQIDKTVEATVRHCERIQSRDDYSPQKSVAQIKSDPEVKQFLGIFISAAIGFLIQKLLEYLWDRWT